MACGGGGGGSHLRNQEIASGGVVGHREAATPQTAFEYGVLSVFASVQQHDHVVPLPPWIEVVCVGNFWSNLYSWQ